MVACGMTGLAAGYAIGIVGDAVSLPLCPTIKLMNSASGHMSMNRGRLSLWSLF
jgi:hypothetical protein